MAHWQRGEQVVGREWLLRAIEWMDSSPTSDPELVQFRREAEQLIPLPARTPTGDP